MHIFFSRPESEKHICGVGEGGMAYVLTGVLATFTSLHHSS